MRNALLFVARHDEADTTTGDIPETDMKASEIISCADSEKMVAWKQQATYR